MRRLDGIHVWGAGPHRSSSLRRIAGPEYVWADWHDDEFLLSTAAGEIVRCDEDLRPVGRQVPVQGRFRQPLVWQRSHGREIVTDLADGTVVGGAPALDRPGRLDRRWSVAGTLPALHRDAAGRARLSVAPAGESRRPLVVVHLEPGAADASRTRIPVHGRPAVALVPYGRSFHLLVNMHTGMHTVALAVFDETGTLLWEDASHGGHPSRPGVLPLVAADDHGRLRLHDEAGRVLADTDWTAAYTSPGRRARSGRRHRSPAPRRRHPRVAALDVAGRTMWRTNSTLWRHFSGRSALARGGDGGWVLGVTSRDGRLEAVDVATGDIRWSRDAGPTMPGRCVSAGDVDGDRADEFLVGTLDGRLMCVAVDGTLTWECRFPAAVTNPVLAEVDGDGHAEILVATAHCRLRVLGVGHPLTA